MNPSSPSDHAHNPKNTHPDMRSDAPGRIPESLIDAAIDGELNEDMQREIAHALRYDPIRKQELMETSDAINALQMPISTPDFTGTVLARADRNRRFIPASWRRHVRAGRLGIAAGVLLTLMSVAGLQRVYPRLTTLASHPTPVLDVEQAVERDTNRFAQTVTQEVRTLQASVVPMAQMLSAPGHTDNRFDLKLTSASPQSGSVGLYANSFSGSNDSVRFGSVHFGYLVASKFIVHQADARFPQTNQSPRLIASANMLNWVSSNRSSHADMGSSRDSRSDVGSESHELDVPSLP